MFDALSRRGKVRALSYLAAAVLTLVGLCFSLYRTSLSYQRAVTNGYLRAFSTLVSSVDTIDTVLQKEIYAVTPAMLAQLSAQIQTEAATAQMAIGELPYAYLELEQTAAFLAKTGDMASALARSAAVNGALTPEELQALQALSLVTSQLRERLDTLESDLISGTLSLSDVAAVEARLAMSENGDVLAGSEFQDVEAEFPELPTLTYDGPFSEHLTQHRPLALAGLNGVDEAEALSAAASFLEVKEDVFSLSGFVEGEIPTYTFSAAIDGGEVTAAVTRTGGIVRSVYNSRPIGEQTLSFGEGRQRALEFLTARGYSNMAETYFYCADGKLTVNYAWVQENVVCYADLIHVTVALDTGSVVGYDCSGYLSNHTRRTLDTPSVTAEQAQEKVSPLLTVLSGRLAMIPSEGEYETLCWEFICEAENGQHYLVCINAQTGSEEKILILIEDENGTLAI